MPSGLFDRLVEHVMRCDEWPTLETIITDRLHMCSYGRIKKGQIVDEMMMMTMIMMKTYLLTLPWEALLVLLCCGY